MSGAGNRLLLARARQTLKHHALEDACYQAQVVAEIWQRHSDAFIEHC
ncbi:MAG: hypothetical protein ACMX3H_03310 [Sodalis sp. (in: enterobacteria)]